MANTWTTTRSVHSGFQRSGADLVTTITSFKSVFVGLGRRRRLKKADFWAILHYILYPKQDDSSK